MKSEWRVTKNVSMGDKPFGVYRLRDTGSVDHSGNREYQNSWYSERKEAEEVAIQLNKRGE